MTGLRFFSTAKPSLIGFGAKTDRERCVGCLHDFGTPESAWVREYAPKIGLKNPGDVG